MNTNKLFAGLLAAVISAGALAAGVGAETVTMEISAEKYTININESFDEGIFRCTGVPSSAMGSNATLQVSIKLPKGDKTEKIVIPDKINGVAVTEIGCIRSNNNENIKSIVIPGSVKRIHKDAFKGCTSLETIKIPENVTDIGFYREVHSWNMEEFSYPAHAFSGCPSLKAIEVDPKNQSFSSKNGVLYSKNADTLFYVPNKSAEIKNGTYTIPNTVKIIGTSAFMGCSLLKTISIPNSVESISKPNNPFYTQAIDNPFAGCSKLSSVSVGSGNKNYISVDGVLYNKDKTQLICCPAAKSGALNIPASAESICYNAFYGCNISVTSENPKYISIDNVLYSEEEMYDGEIEKTLIYCPVSKTGTFNIPNGVTNISKNSFGGCAKLTSVSVPKSVSYINEKAFSGCTSLSVLKIADGCSAVININAVDNNTSVVIPSSIKFIYGSSIDWANKNIYYIGTKQQWDKINFVNVLWEESLAAGCDTANITYNYDPVKNPIKVVSSNNLGKVTGIKSSAYKNTIKLTWNKNEDADSYVVKYSTDKKTWKIKTVKTNSVTLKNLKSGQKYYLKVAAKKDGVTGEFSKVFSVTTKK